RFFSFALDSTTNPKTLYSGSASGIHISTDGGRRWKTFRYNPQDTGSCGITGNWVIAIGVQYLGSGNIVWASTRKALGQREYDGVSYLLPGDSVFHHIKDTIIVWNFAFAGGTAIFATTSGLYCTNDTGKTLKRAEIIDYTTGIRITTTEVVSALWDGSRLWAGTSEGLAYSYELCGENWRIIGTFRKAENNDTYAAPSPFSPIERGTIIVVRANALKEEKAHIYDYSMNLVKTIPLHHKENDTYIGQWEGKNEDGKLVANGIYFYRIRAQNKDIWGKIVVIK
ncbi:MAG: FlgD immunoglobulin-like domain containing protein, partial [bacterium]